MAEWVGHLAVAVAPEHIGGRHGGLRTGSDGALEPGVAVVDVQVERHGEPFSDCGDTVPISGTSSPSMMRESPIWISACISFSPSGMYIAPSSLAPNACL